MVKLIEHTYGNHIYMKMQLDSGNIAEIDVYITAHGEIYKTSADNGAERDRVEIIRAFNELY